MTPWGGMSDLMQIIKGWLCPIFIRRKFEGFQFSSYEMGIVLAVCTLLLLNWFDGVMTLWGLSVEVIEEANPIMASIISKNPSGVMGLKLLLPVVLGALCWLEKDRSQRLIKYSFGLVLVSYSFIDIFHLYWWYLL